jgi:peroxiredoxin
MAEHGTFRWLNRSVFAAVIALCVLTLVSVHRSSDPGSMIRNLRLARSREAETALKHPFDDMAGKSTPDLTFSTVNGKAIRLSGFHGNTVLFFYSLDYCPPCDTELTALDQLLTTGQASNLRVIGMVRQLSGREIPRQELLARLDGQKHSFPLVMDDHTIDMLFGNIKVVPVTIFIDSSGTITKQALSQTYSDLLKVLSTTNAIKQLR